jgi:hypothetical protein
MTQITKCAKCQIDIIKGKNKWKNDGRWCNKCHPCSTKIVSIKKNRNKKERQCKSCDNIIVTGINRWKNNNTYCRTCYFKSNKLKISKDCNNNPSSIFSNNNENKRKANRMFTDAILKSFGFKLNNSTFMEDKMIFYLDGYEQCTKKTLEDSNILKKYHLLAQHVNTNDDIKVVDKHIAEGLALVAGDIGKITTSQDISIFHNNADMQRLKECIAAYFDMCGQPTNVIKESIIKFIKNSRLVNGAILAFTFARRIKIGGPYEEHKQIFIDELCTSLMREHDLYLQPIEEVGEYCSYNENGKWSGNMDHFMFRVVKYPVVW